MSLVKELFSSLTKGIQFKGTSFEREKKKQLSETLEKRSDITSSDKTYAVRVFGENIPSPIQSFSESFDLFPHPCFDRIQKSHTQPTHIQKYTIPVLINRRDLMACAPTGSGKTLAYLLPIIKLLDRHRKKVGFRGMIVVPTRELVHQLERDFLLLKEIGASSNLKICFLNKPKLIGFKSTPPCSFDILISTPKLLASGLEEKCINIDGLKIAILDEADHLLGDSLLVQTDSILSRIPQSTTKALFSATLHSSVESMANSFLSNPIRIFVGTFYAATQTITQKLLFVGQEEGKRIAMHQIVKGEHPEIGKLKVPILVFVDSIEKTEHVMLDLEPIGVKMDSIHGDKNIAERNRIIEDFRLGKIWILITTELLARGIDFKAVSSVVNYDFPETPASYIHRIGRTGRAGRQGTAVTFFTTEDVDKLRSVANVMKASGCEVPAYMLGLKNVKFRDRTRKRKYVSKY